jgi:hypothetical protein
VFRWLKRAHTARQTSDENSKKLQALISERDELSRRCSQLATVVENMGFPPGHFYSVVVDAHDPHVISAVRSRTSHIERISVDEKPILETLRAFAKHYARYPFSRDNEGRYRFHLNNTFLGPHDSFALFSIILELEPSRVVEIGSGFSSALLLDVNEHFLEGKMSLTFIDPSLEQLRALIHGSELKTATMIERGVQDVPFEVFDALRSGDLLFIDSSHVSKTASDVNYYLFEILPKLPVGTVTHIHDIFYPFEYPEDWVLNQKRSWNEAYLVRAFLEYNTAFEVMYWSSYASCVLSEQLRRSAPLCADDEGGSLWLRKVS